MSVRIKMTPGLRKLLDGRTIPDHVEGEVSNNLPYILALEYGTSRQAPRGMVARQRAGLLRLVAGELRRAFELYSPDFEKAARAGVSFGVVAVARAVSDATPVDTGRAKGAWTMRLPSGKTFTIGPEVTLERQATLAKANRAARKEGHKAAGTKHKAFIKRLRAKR